MPKLADRDELSGKAGRAGRRYPTQQRNKSSGAHWNAWIGTQFVREDLGHADQQSKQVPSNGLLLRGVTPRWRWRSWDSWALPLVQCFNL